MKAYKAVFFDWDGTAVLSRKAPVTDVIAPMKRLLGKGIKLVIVSGTTYENIAGGKLHTYFTAGELQGLYLGLGRGAYNYRFDSGGMPYIWKEQMPDASVLLTIHDICYEIHRILLADYAFPTDIIFSRPNYCKVDLMVQSCRGDQLFLQEHEAAQLTRQLEKHKFHGGLPGLIALAETAALKRGLTLSATSDAKYLEIGLTSKSDNVNTILLSLCDEFSMVPEECAFWGDEYIGLDNGLFGSDSYMITPRTRQGDFFDVSDLPGPRPEQVLVLGGGVKRFIEFLEELADIH